MQERSFKVRCSPPVWLLSLLLAACVSTHLDDPVEATADRAAEAAEGDGIMPSVFADHADGDPASSTCQARCGNGHIDPDEDCEIGLPGWTSENCDTSCRQSAYPDSTPCTFEIAEPFAFYEQGTCPDLPGFRVGCFYLFGQYCQILCSNTEDCPIGFTCHETSNPEALGPGWCILRR